MMETEIHNHGSPLALRCELIRRIDQVCAERASQTAIIIASPASSLINNTTETNSMTFGELSNLIQQVQDHLSRIRHEFVSSGAQFAHLTSMFSLSSPPIDRINCFPSAVGLAFSNQSLPSSIDDCACDTESSSSSSIQESNISSSPLCLSVVSMMACWRFGMPIVPIDIDEVISMVTIERAHDSVDHTSSVLATPLQTSSSSTSTAFSNFSFAKSKFNLKERILDSTWLILSDRSDLCSHLWINHTSVTAFRIASSTGYNNTDIAHIKLYAYYCSDRSSNPSNPISLPNTRTGPTAANCMNANTDDDSMYLIFTSGSSSGSPRGVVGHYQ
jgi:hypothetical protein